MYDLEVQLPVLNVCNLSTGTTVRAASVYNLQVEFSEPVVCGLICTGRAVGTPCIVCFALVLLDPVMCNLMAAF